MIKATVFGEPECKGFDGSTRNQTKGMVCAVDVRDGMKNIRE